VLSVSRQIPRLGVLATCGLLLLGGLAGCTTTQEKAERAQARATHILEARAERQKRKKAADGTKTHADGGKSARQPSGKEGK
jgi:hypothetical protein